MTPEKHIEESPELAKARKARAVLKNVAASTAEILKASETMSQTMKRVAESLRRASKMTGDVMLANLKYDHSNSRFVSQKISEFLVEEAAKLEGNAV